MSGKGSGRRPQQVDEQTALDNWARVFGAKADASSHKEEENGEAAEVSDSG